MKLPRRLYQRPDGTYCEESEIETGHLVGPAGMEISDPEAERLGIVAYFVSHPVSEVTSPEMDEKAMEQSGFEDKAEEKGEDKAEEEPPTGLHVAPEQRRRPGR